jgi:O-acetyl-ADP-ribose deacetylase (regulator of RNase III)
MQITLVKGDIAQQDAEAIVNAANNHLWMGAGVAGAIKRAGGQEIEREAVAKGPIPIGEAVVTGSGRLKARYVIHAAVMGRDLRTDADKIRQATQNSLRRADELALKSIAFPALGTGVGGFSLEECARIMLEVVRTHGTSGTSLERVVFVLYDQLAYQAFERVWRSSQSTSTG